mgnify:CR=1 FL=1
MIAWPSFAPLVPWPLFWLVCAGISVVLVLYGVGRGRAIFLRTGAALAVILALSGPMRREDDRQSLPDIVVIVADTSESVTVAKRSGEVSRITKTLSEKLAVDKSLEVRTIEAGAGADETRLFEALDRGLAGMPPERVGAVFLVTDGRLSDALLAQNRPFPIYGLISGVRNEIDRRLTILSAPREGLVGVQTNLQVRIEDESSTGATVALRVSVDGAPPALQEVTVGDIVRVPVTPRRRGPVPIALSVESKAGELTTLNNVAAATITGVRDRLRVLLVTGEPHAGERAWRNLLRADPGVDLVHFTILRPPEKQDSTPVEELALIAFPVRELFEEKLDSFDLIVFDRFRRLEVLPDAYLENVANWVRKGGALLVAMGPRDAEKIGQSSAPSRGGPVDLSNPFGGFFDPFSPRAEGQGLWATPLADILPARPTGRIIEEPFQPSLTATGRLHPASASLVSGANKWGRWYRLIEAKPVGEAGENPVLLEANGRPLLVIGRKELGRVALIASDQVWLWARGYDGGGPFADLFNRVSHWLMAEPDLEDEQLRLTAQDGLTIDRRSARFGSGADMPSLVALTGPDGAERTVALERAENGRFKAVIANPEPGLWRATGDGLQASIALGPRFPAETQDVRADAGTLESQGVPVRWVSSGDSPPNTRRVGQFELQSGSDWLGVRRTNTATITSTRETPVLPTVVWLVLAILFGFLAWWREGRA